MIKKVWRLSDRCVLRSLHSVERGGTARSVMVDYSKWDNFGDEEDEEETPRGPVVTTFEGEKGRSFVIGPQGAKLVKTQDEAASKSKKVSEKISGNFQLDCRNGAVTEHFTWSQDRHEVTLRRVVSSILKASQIKMAYDACGNSLTASNTQTGEEFFSGILRYKFEINDEDDLCPVQWELVTMPDISSEKSGGCKVLEILFKKVSPIPGSVIWWKNVFVNDPEIDVTAIPGRTQVSQEVAGAWDEAHKLFKERISTREKITVDLDEDEDED